MAAWDPTVAFYALCTAVQLALGARILARARRNLHAWALGGLFVLNGALATASALLVVGGSSALEAWGYGLRNWLDPPTSMLLLYLALAFPHRARWVEAHPWRFRALLGGVFAVFFAVTLARQLGQNPVADPLLGTAYRLLFSVVLQVGTWAILMLRWSRLFVREASPVQRSFFQFLFAAIAMRAVHLAILAPVQRIRIPIHFPEPYFVAGNAAAFLMDAVAAIAAAVAFMWLFRARRQQGSEEQRATTFVLAFMLAGAAEALVSLTALLGPASSRAWATSVFVNFDLYFIRPVLVWLALWRYQPFSWTPERPATRGLATAAFSASFLPLALLPLAEAILGPGVPAAVAALGAGAFLGVGFAILIYPYLQGVADARPAHVEAYVAILEDLQRRQVPVAAWRAAAQAAGSSAVSQAQHEALAAAVQGRWASAPSMHWAPGDVVRGRYRIVKLLGEGTAGTCFLAADVLSDQKVVLKRTTKLDAATRDSMLRECHALQSLRHPNILRLVRTEVFGGETMLVLEHAPGGSLATRLERGPMPHEETRAVATALLTALEAVHAAGFLHRDIKPSNILFAADGRVLLADFGASAPMPSKQLVEATQDLPTVGTLRYMAPEQARGSGARRASDLYSVGLVLLACRQGRPPYATETDEFTLRNRIADGRGPSLPASLGPWLPVLQQALKRDPAQRFPDAASFRAALPG
ncbi:MAG: eukaryotic-like serine/threonine-protein kinase [Thermoplasmata archaeon]|nr:eukaryotic-like serine/threonine-protein kinase [Thermoplasmata archaeon]